MLAPDAEVMVMGVPLDLGVRKLGVDMGPTALRYAGVLEALRFGCVPFEDAGDLKVMTNFELDAVGDAERSRVRLAEIVRVSEELAGRVHAAMAGGKTPLVLGGDHSTAIGSIAGAAKAAGRLGLLWIDAHPDSNTPETSPSGNIHGMPLAVSLGRGLPELTNCFGFAPKVRPEDVCIIGAKDIDPGEREFLAEIGVRMFTTYDIQDMGLAEVMREAADTVAGGTDAVYVSFDTDVMDRSFAPGTGITTRGGLTYREISHIMQFIGDRIQVAAMDVIEVNPLLDKANSTAELCVELTMSALGIKYTDYEKSYLRNNAPACPEGR